MKRLKWILIVSGIIAIAFAMLFKPNVTPAKPKQEEKDYYYWLKQPRKLADTESKARLSKVYKATMLYCADYDVYEFDVSSFRRMYSFIRVRYTGDDGVECFQSPLAPPEMMARTKLGYIANYPSYYSDSIFDTGMNRNQLYEKDPHNYPILVDPFIDAIYAKQDDPVTHNVLYTSGTVKEVQLINGRVNMKTFRK